MNKCKAFALKADVKPSNAENKGLSWKSSNTKIATVDSKGTVTGKSEGSVTITATAKDSGKVTKTIKLYILLLYHSLPLFTVYI